MKKILLALSILSSTMCYSQVAIGLNGGVLFPVTQYNFYNPASGYKSGIEAIFTLSNHFKLRTGAEIYWFSFNSKRMITDNNGRPKGTGTVVDKSNYIAIPVGLRYVFNQDKIRPFIDFSVSYLLNISHKTFDDNIGSLSSLPPTKSIISPSLGAGLEINTSEKTYVSFMLNYQHQLNPIYKSLKDVRFNSINGIISVGYKF